MVGLFQGMFEKNMLTFNPGCDQNAQKLATFTDIRELQRQLKAQGVQLVQEADERSTGPASFIAIDPDGNPVLVDQHGYVRLLASPHSRLAIVRQDVPGIVGAGCRCAACPNDYCMKR